MTHRFKFILMIAILLGFLAGFIPSGRVQAYWLTNYVVETYGLGTKWDRGGYGGHAYWYRQRGGIYVSSQSSWWSQYHSTSIVLLGKIRHNREDSITCLSYRQALLCQVPQSGMV